MENLRQELSQKTPETKELRAAINHDARNRAKVMKEIREGLQEDSKKDRTLHGALILPNSKDIHEFQVISRDKIALTIRLPSVKDSSLGNNAYPYMGSVLKIENQNNRREYALLIHDGLGYIEEIIRLMIRMSNIIYETYSLGGTAFYDPKRKILQDENGKVLLDFSEEIVSRDIIDKLASSLEYIITPAKQRKKLKWNQEA